MLGRGHSQPLCCPWMSTWTYPISVSTITMPQFAQCSDRVMTTTGREGKAPARWRSPSVRMPLLCDRRFPVWVRSDLSPAVTSRGRCRGTDHRTGSVRSTSGGCGPATGSGLHRCLLHRALHVPRHVQSHRSWVVTGAEIEPIMVRPSVPRDGPVTGPTASRLCVTGPSQLGRPPPGAVVIPALERTPKLDFQTLPEVTSGLLF